MATTGASLPFLWFVPSIVAMAITGLGRVVVEAELRDYVRTHYPELFARAKRRPKNSDRQQAGKFVHYDSGR